MINIDQEALAKWDAASTETTLINRRKHIYPNIIRWLSARQVPEFYLTACSLHGNTDELLAAECGVISKFMIYNQGMAGKIHYTINTWQQVHPMEPLFYTRMAMIFVPDQEEYAIRVLTFGSGVFCHHPRDMVVKIESRTDEFFG